MPSLHCVDDDETGCEPSGPARISVAKISRRVADDARFSARIKLDALRKNLSTILDAISGNEAGAIIYVCEEFIGNFAIAPVRNRVKPILI